MMLAGASITYSLNRSKLLSRSDAMAITMEYLESNQIEYNFEALNMRSFVSDNIVRVVTYKRSHIQCFKLNIILKH